MHISSFKKGDRIVRVERSDNDDGSYMGDEIIFLGIANSRIYIIINNSREVYNHSLSVAEWSNGWNYYVNPSTLIDNEILDCFDIKTIENYLRSKKIKKIKNV